MGSALPPSSCRDSIAAIESVMAHSYGIEVVSCDPLGGEWDRTYKVATAGGGTLVVKHFPTDAHLENPRWQHVLLDRAAARPQIGAQKVIRSVDGDDLVEVAIGDAQCLLAAYSWLPGTIVAEVAEHTEEMVLQWGVLAGNLAAALAGVSDEDTVTAVHPWAVMAAPQLLGSVLGAVVDPRRRELVTGVSATFEATVSPRADVLPKSVVHQDLNDYNVLARMDGAGTPTICGVIDFDALYTARVAEAAVAAAYAMLRKADPVQAFVTLARGFDSVVMLNDDEIAVVYPLAIARLALNAATWAHRAGGVADALRAGAVPAHMGGTGVVIRRVGGCGGIACPACTGLRINEKETCVLR